LQELKKQTPELPKPEGYRRPYNPRRKIAEKDDGQMAKTPGMHLTPEQREQIRKFGETISAWMQSVRELFGNADERFDPAEERNDKRVIKRANQIREFGEKLAMLSGKKSFLIRHFEKYQAAFPNGTTIKYCRLAMATWRAYPKPVENQFVAAEVVAKETKLINEEKDRRNIEAKARREKALRKKALAAAISTSKLGPNLVPTIRAAVNSEKSQFYWDFFK
jgi:hypothetical protein